MTIDEAIEELKSKNGYYVNNGMTDVAEFNTKIIRWLEELKLSRQELNELRKYSYVQGLSDGYIKAIDDFAETLIPRLTDAIYPKDVEGMRNLINDVAEHLKEQSK